MKLFKRNKNGNIALDSFGIMGALLVAVLMLAVSYTIFYYFNVEIQAVTIANDIGDNATRTTIAEMGNNFLLLDKLIPFVMVFLWGAVLMTSLRVFPIHPIFFLVSLVTLFILTLVSIFVTDVATEIVNDSVWSFIIHDLTNSMFFVYNFHYISFFVILASLVFFYGKGQFSPGDGGTTRSELDSDLGGGDLE